MSEVVRIKLPPKDMMISDFVQQWSAAILGTSYKSEVPVPITTHIQAANEAHNMYPAADEAVVTKYDEGYEVRLFKDNLPYQTITFPSQGETIDAGLTNGFFA